MAGLAHLGVGLAAKRVAPTIPAGVLVAAAYAIDMVWAGFWAAGIEHYVAPGVDSAAPWSHGLFMAMVWSALAGTIALLISRSRRTGLIFGLLVFSHWVIDFIAKPMTHAFPTDAGLPLLFGRSPTVGLGAYGSAAGEYIGEYGTVLLGAMVYVLTWVKLRNQRKSLAAGGGTV